MSELSVTSKDCRYGQMTWLSHDAPIGKSLAQYGEWAQLEIEFASKFIKEGDVVIDAGANIGTHTLPFSELVSNSGHVYSVEAHPDLAGILKKNVSDNHLDNVTVYSLALGSQADEAWAPALTGDRINSGSFTASHEQKENDIPIKMSTIDELGIDSVNFLKLDVEGSELAVCKGGERLIRSSLPIIFAECNSLHSGWELASYLMTLDYCVYYHSSLAFNLDNFRNCKSNMFGFAHESALLFIPPMDDDDYSLDEAARKITCLDDFVEAFQRTPRYGDAGLTTRSYDYLHSHIKSLKESIRGLRRRSSNEKRAVSHLENRVGRLAFHMAKLLSNEEWQNCFEFRKEKNLVVGFENDLKDIKESGLFDEQWYLKQTNDTRLEQIEALEHYLFFGGELGLSPSEDFDGSDYLKLNPVVYDLGINPLVNYIRSQSAPESFTEQADVNEDIDRADPPKAPKNNLWKQLADSIVSADKKQPLVDVIIPIYKGYDDTLACIYSVLNSPNETAYELVVINDSSPDVELSAKLRQLSEIGLFTLVENDSNSGFVKSSNKGMKAHLDRDVVLLNSDTIVYGDWLDRLHTHIIQNPDVSTVTPFSNNATICSYPFPNADNPQKLEIDYADLDEIASDINKGMYRDIPTGVGFCFYISRDALSKLGYFDEDAFGMGYGEENDFCMRAHESGWRNIVAADVFVRHTGEVSFGDKAIGNKSNALKVLLERYPDYLFKVNTFVNMDMLRDERCRLDLARLKRTIKGNCILFVTHTKGGGIEKHIRDMAGLLEKENVSVIVARPSGEYGDCISVDMLDRLDIPNINNLDLLLDQEDIVTIFMELGVKHMHIHSLVGFSEQSFSAITEISNMLGIRYDYSFHDYTPICPRVHLYDGTNSYCGEKGIETCRNCIRDNGTPFGKVDIVQWRMDWEKFIGGARKLFTPSQDAAKRIAGYFPDETIDVRPHFEPIVDSGETIHRDKNEPLNVAIIGAIGPHKGSAQLLLLAKNANDRNLPIHFTIIGYTDLLEFESLPNVTVTGKYATEEEAVLAIQAEKCHVAMIPSVWPETYCYTLSIAVRAGLFPVVFDIGAPADRVRELSWGMVLPMELLNDPAGWGDQLLSLDINNSPVNIYSRIADNKHENLLKNYYKL